MVENDMRQAIIDWLARDGKETAHECWVVAGYCDVIGFRFHPRIGRPIPALDCVVAIELKMSNARGVIYQAKANRRCVNASYAAMPRARCDKMRQRTADAFRENEVGLLAVDGDRVDVLIPATWTDLGSGQWYKDKWWQWHLKNQKINKNTCLLPVERQRQQKNYDESTEGMRGYCADTARVGG